MIKKILITLTFIIVPFFVNAEKINDVVIDGNSRISKETILIYGNINNGDEISEKKINDIIKNLYQTIFST